MITAKLSSKGQVVLPKIIRDNLKIDPGSLFEISLEGERIILTPLKKSIVDRLYGKYRNEPLLEALEAEHGEETSEDAGS